jgi:xylan 1,4-beta-xylosidase
MLMNECDATSDGLKNNCLSQNKQFTSMIRTVLISVSLFFCQSTFAQQAPVSIRVDASKSIGEMKPFWSFFGYDEPNYTTRKNGQKLLRELKQLSPVPVHIRTHNLLNSKGNSAGPDLKWGFTDAYHEDAKGNPVYYWTIVDSIVDTYIRTGIKPLMEIGFMPKDLSSKPEPYEHTWSKNGKIWTGWTYPPKDYNKWRELVYQWVKHSVDRYGKAEVTTWVWELWNEPNIG